MSSHGQALGLRRGVPSIRLALRRPMPLALASAARAALAASLAYAVARLLRPEPVWAPVSALIVLQGSVASTFGAVANRIAGTVLGAAVAVGVAVALAPVGAPMIVQLAAAVALAALAITSRPAARVATWTSVIVLMSAIAPGHPLVNALWRVGEVAIGATVGGAVGALIAPARAHLALERQLAATLAAMAAHLRAAVRPAAPERADPLDVEAKLRRCDALAAEAQRERAATGTVLEPTAAVRAARRLWHSLVTLERVAVSPLPAGAAAELDRPVRAACEALARHLEALARAVLSEARAPAPTLLGAALDRVAHAVGQLRRDGVIRAMPDDQAESVYLRRFALERAAEDAAEVLERALAPADDAE